MSIFCLSFPTLLLETRQKNSTIFDQNNIEALWNLAYSIQQDTINKHPIPRIFRTLKIPIARKGGVRNVFSLVNKNNKSLPSPNTSIQYAKKNKCEQNDSN